jgi:hypothetical protein
MHGMMPGGPSALQTALGVEFVSLLIALVSLVLLIRRVREARRAAGEGSGRVG